MNRPPLPRLLLTGFTAFLALLAPGCGGQIGSAGEGHEDPGAALESTTQQALSASDIMARAEGFMNANIIYCGGPRGGQDLTSCGEGTCHQPLGPWDAYRSDCSGFVSYTWQIPSDPSSSEYMQDRGGSLGWTSIGLDSLRAGDALVTQGHIKLFKSFSGSSAALIYEEYDCNRVGHRQVQHFTRSGNHLWFDGDSRTYHAIRRNGASAGGGTPSPTAPSAPATAKHYVDLFSSATGYASATTASTANGRIYSGRNYVFCRKWGGKVGSGNSFNHWWMLTDLDSVYSGRSGRAYVSAYYLSRWGNDEAKDSAGNDLPTCSL